MKKREKCKGDSCIVDVGQRKEIDNENQQINDRYDSGISKNEEKEMDGKRKGKYKKQ